MPKLISLFLVGTGVVTLGSMWLFGREQQVTEVVPQGVREAVAAPRATINGIEIQLEVVRTAEEKARGLSGRESLEENAGMLFVYDEQTIPSFWMKEMNFPIDIIWIGADRKIADISENLAPETFPELFHPRTPIQYVLEVNANWAKSRNISIGDAVEFQVDF